MSDKAVHYTPMRIYVEVYCPDNEKHKEWFVPIPEAGPILTQVKAHVREKYPNYLKLVAEGTAPII